MKKCILSLLLSLFVLTAGAQKIPVDPQIRHGKLDNGLTYFIQHNGYPEKRAEFYIAQKVGSILEDDNQAGLAHFLEHMAFNGTKNFPGKVLETLERYGAKMGENLNAYTGFDQTVYYLSGIPTTNEGIVDTCLLILHDWSGFIALKDDAIDKERSVIKEEWRTSTGASLRMWDKQFPVIFKGSKYADRMPIGKMDIIENFKYDELRDYYHKWYRPDLQGIIIVGDIDVDKVEAKIKSLFADVPKPINPAKRIYYPVLDNGAPIVSIETDVEATSTNVSLYVKHDVDSEEFKGTKEWVIQQYVKEMVSQMLSSRFREIGQQADAPYNNAYAYYGDFVVSKTKHAWTTGATAKEGKISETLTVLVRENERVRKHGFTETEIERAKTNLLKNSENSYNNRNKRYNPGIVKNILENYLNNDVFPSIEYEYELLKEVIPTLGKNVFDAFVKKVILDKNIVLTVTGPEKAGLTYPTKSDLINLIEKVKTLPVDPYVETVSSEPLVSNLPQAGSIVKTEKGDKFGETIWTLSNGAKVVLKKTIFKDDEITMSSNSYGGTSIFADEDMLHADFIGSTTHIGGLGNFNPTDLQKKLAGKSAHVNPWISGYTQGMNGGTTIADMETFFQLIYLNYTSPRKDEDLYKTFIEKRKSHLLNAKASPNYAFNDSIHRTTHGISVRKKWLEVEDIDKVNYDKVISMYKQCFANPGGATFTFVGTIDEDKIKPLVEKYLACLPSGNKNATYKTLPSDVRKGQVKNHFTQKMETPKASIFMRFSATINRDGESLFKREVLQSVLDQVFFRTMRGDEGGTYGVGSSVMLDRIPSGLGGLWLSYTTEPKRVEAMNAIAHREIQNLADNGPQQDEFDKAMENVIKNRTEWQGKNGFWAAVLSNLHFYGEDENTNYLDRIKAVTPKDVQQMMKEILAEGNVIEVVMTDK